jgi:hypothetical protein
MTADPSAFEAPFIYMLNSTLDAVAVAPNASPDDVKTQQLAIAMALGALDPGDAIDTLSAARAITAHHAAMECYRRAAKPDVPDRMLTQLLARAASLSRLTTQTIQAIERRKAVARGVKARAKAAGQAATQAGSQNPMPSDTRQSPPPASGSAARPNPGALNPGNPLSSPRHPTPSASRPTAAPGNGAQHPMPSETPNPASPPSIRSPIQAAG